MTDQSPHTSTILQLRLLVKAIGTITDANELPILTEAVQFFKHHESAEVHRSVACFGHGGSRPSFETFDKMIVYPHSGFTSSFNSVSDSDETKDSPSLRSENHPGDGPVMVLACPINGLPIYCSSTIDGCPHLQFFELSSFGFRLRHFLLYVNVSAYVPSIITYKSVLACSLP
jgi:hypothetical protein